MSVAPKSVPSTDATAPSDSKRTSQTDIASQGVAQELWVLLQGFVQEAAYMFKDDFRNVWRFDPLPENFDYSYSLLSYFWTVVFMTSRTMGSKLGRATLVKAFLGLLGAPGLFLLTYVLLPLYAVLLHKKTPQTRVTTSERRICIIGFAFFLGVATEFFWSNYVQPTGAPSYYNPVVVGLTIQIAGPLMQRNRFGFLASTVGIASAVSLLVAKVVGVLNVTYVLCAIITATLSLVNLQLLVADTHKTEHEMTYGHLRQLILSIYYHIVITMLFATYQPAASK
ncbi:hypothetical protein QR680_007674 [Steinernema hermaphroditum]|uniref:Uncharacterized protein n=1 Tax=Steinernema hermaphroditum TaxID=289476 RepID=A0AA39IDZ6_9BILA|nr:hypothetical protein QR680_007674 [Steinernema hermaphroditum]